MADYLIHDSTLEDIADAIREKTGGSALIAPEDMADEIASIGGRIENGLIYKNVDATTGYPEEVEFYGEIVPQYFAGYTGTVYTANLYGERYILTDGTKRVLKGAFTQNSHIRYLYIPESVVSIDSSSPGLCSYSSVESVDYYSSTDFQYMFFNNCRSLARVFAPNIKAVRNNTGSSANSTFYNCTSLESAELGSVGSAITTIHTTTFANCTQTGLTIIVYTTASYVDTLVTNIRNGATNATVIIKASEETTYNGTTYNASDTILTSEVTS